MKRSPFVRRPSSVVRRPLLYEENQTSPNKGHRTQDKEPKTNPKSAIPNPKLLSGDLDNIILKALRKEPLRRYASVEQFAEDIRRYLSDLPVIARPDTLRYRASKFIQRNKIAVVSASLVFLALIGGIIGTSWQAIRAERERNLAEERYRQVRELANNIVFKYYDEAEKLPNSTVIRSMFVKDSLDYFDSLARDANADDALKSELARAFLRIAKVQGRPFSPNLGDSSGAIENYRKGIELLEPLVTKSNDTNLQNDLVAAYSDFAVLLRQNGNSADAESALRKSLALNEDFLRRNPQNPQLSLRIAANYLFLGDSLPIGRGENENIAAYRQAVEICSRILQTNPNDLRVNSYLNAANERIALNLETLAKSAQADENPALAEQILQEAAPLLRRNIEISESMVRLYPEDILSAALLDSAHAQYGAFLLESGDYAKALEFLQKTEKIYRERLEKDDVSVGQKSELAFVELKLGAINSRLGRITKSELLYSNAFLLLDKLVKQDAQNFDFLKLRGEMKFEYADELLRRGEIEKAKAVYQKAFNEMQEIARQKDSLYAESLQGIFYEKAGDCELKGGNKPGAVFNYQRAIEIWQKSGFQTISGARQNDKPELLQRKINRL